MKQKTKDVTVTCTRCRQETDDYRWYGVNDEGINVNICFPCIFAESKPKEQRLATSK